MAETKTEREGTILNITFDVYSPILKETFRNKRTFRSMEDFRLHAYALYSGNWSIVSVEKAD